MGDLGLAKRLVDALHLGFPDNNRPDLRPVHTFGVGATGHFVASDVAHDFCVAEHFQGKQILVTMRFSNGSGSVVQRDGWSDIRGLATQFHLDNNRATDLLAMTLGEFFTPTIETFLSFAEATPPKPVFRESVWRKICDLLCLTLPLPDPYPGQTTSPNAGAEEYANKHAESQVPVLQATFLGAPVSYTRATYHAVHAFVVEAPDGARRWVRFTWQPVAGMLTTDADPDIDPHKPPVDDYLRKELRDCVAEAPARFLLMMSIGEAGDDFNDPSRPWPPHRNRVVMGTLTIDAVPKDQTENCERLSFNPMLLVAGIEASDDPILRARRCAYEYSRKRRGGNPCPF